MVDSAMNSALAEEVKGLALEGFQPRFGKLEDSFESHPRWRRLRELGTELWLDTGSIDDAAGLWTRELTALTTNNTLLNREVQTGAYDSLMAKANDLLAARQGLSDAERMLEIAFILNARHGLRLVERFDARVSVELHTDLAGDVDRTLAYARRYYAICPERFIVKVPLTPAGLLATRKLSGEGIPINHTLGFSARQNYVIARIGRPQYVNVFLGRLNSFVADNGLGDGTYVGERATVASQRAVRELRQAGKSPAKQIGASFRSGRQVADLAGIDVMTMPPKVAAGFLDLAADVADQTATDYQPPLADGVDPAAARLETLWDIRDDLAACLDALEAEDLDQLTPGDLVSFFADHRCGDVLVDWSDEQVAASRAEGKIPKLANWAKLLGDKAIGLDALMNLAGLNAFRIDQQAMDHRVAGVLK